MSIHEKMRQFVDACEAEKLEVIIVVSEDSGIAVARGVSGRNPLIRVLSALIERLGEKSKRENREWK